MSEQGIEEFVKAAAAADNSTAELGKKGAGPAGGAPPDAVETEPEKPEKGAKDADDEWLEKHLGGGEKEAAPVVVADDEAETTEAPADEPETETLEVKRDDKGRFTPKEDPEYLEALTALKYEGIPTKALDSMAREEVVAWGMEAKKRANDRKATLDERAARIKELETATQTTGDEGPHSAEPTLLADLRTRQQERLGKLTEELGEDAAKLVSDAFTDIHETFAKIKPPAPQPDARLDLAGELVLENVMAGLRERFPSLTLEGETLEKVNTTASNLIRTGGYHGLSGLREAYEHALKANLDLEALQDAAAEKAEADAAKSKAKAKGRPTIPGGKKQSPASLSMEEREDNFLDELEKGTDPKEAARKWKVGDFAESA